MKNMSYIITLRNETWRLPVGRKLKFTWVGLGDHRYEMGKPCQNTVRLGSKKNK